MSKSKKSFDSRKDDEMKEGYDTVKTDMPKGRFQEDKQVLTPDELGVGSGLGAAPDTTSTVAKAAKTLKSKITIRPDVSVDNLEGKQVGGVPLAAGQVTRSVAGASAVSPADDMSRVPYTDGKYRPDTRYGKKRSDELFEMDNTISEQIVPEVDDLPDLRESPDSTVGYNGRQQFKQTRSKKNFKYVNDDGNEVVKTPQQLLNDTSVDFVTTNKVVYTSGQMLEDEIDAQADYPSVDGEGHAVDVQLHKGNYKPTALNITVANGKISAISISEDRYVVDGAPIVRDQANMNAQVDAHNITKTMIKVQTELGRETAEKWSPLGYVIQQPYQFMSLLHDIEATTGSLAAAAYRSAVSSLAFQKNILSKDGVNPQKNAVLMMTEGFAGPFADSTANSIFNTDFNNTIFKQDLYRQGSAAAIIDMFDSIKKYRTKADLMGMQRSFGLHLSQADNNLNPLHCKAQFIKALDKAHMFSTVTGEYNPMLPIYCTKSVKLVMPLSLNYFLAGWKHPDTLTEADLKDPKRNADTGTYSQYNYTYRDQRNSYRTNVRHPIVEGLIQWLLKHEGAFASTYGNGNITIPFVFDMMAPNMLSFMLCSALQDIVFQRNIIFRDILFANEQTTYIWDDLEGLDKLNPLYSSQLGIGKYTEPLKLGKLTDDSCLREMWGTHMQLSDYSSDSVQYFLPFYFCETAFGTGSGSYTQNEGFYDEKTAFNFAFPSIRQGVRHEYVDLIKAMDPNDVRLALDRWMDIPVFDTTAAIAGTITGVVSDYPLWNEHKSVRTSSVLNNNIKLSALRYEGNSDGRLIVTYNLTNGSNRDLTHHALMLIPKELGFIADDYDPMQITTAIDNLSVVTATLGTEATMGNVLNPAHYYTGLSPLFLTAYRVAPDGYSSAAVSRSAALSQVFYRCFASPDADIINKIFIGATGVVPSIGWNDGVNDDLKAVYNLDSNLESTTAIDKLVQSNARRVWTMLQRFFMPVDRFANCFTQDNSTHSFDPLEGAFYFGVCGTLAADTTQAVLERLDVYDQLGLDYTEDEFCKQSLIFR